MTRDWPETDNEWALTWAAMIARDRIAELEADNKLLQVCGTCGNIEWDYGAWCRFDPDDVTTEEVDQQGPCRFTPSRWVPYWSEP